MNLNESSCQLFNEFHNENKREIVRDNFLLSFDDCSYESNESDYSQINDKILYFNPSNPKTLIETSSMKDNFCRTQPCQENGNLDVKNSIPNFLSQKCTSSTKKEEKTDNTPNTKLKCGRKTENKDIKEIHDKSKSDNIIRKLKIHIIQQKIINMVNNYLKSKKLSKLKLLKLSQKELTTLKKDENMKFMNSTLKEIYYTYKIGDKYLRERVNNNKNLINLIYSKSEYIELQKILNLTFLEFFDIYTYKVANKELSEDLKRKKEEIELFNENFKGIEIFINGIVKKERKKGVSEEKIKEYINKLKLCCEDYKLWFEKKIGRRAKEA